ncbi:MAG: hypothetical protein II666_15450 [Butyrivibrio sp.]|nr:hypothetical protein [Butyrivibrio sp.]
MRVNDFIEKNEIAIIAKADLNNKRFEIKKRDVELESYDLFVFMENNPNIDYGMPGPIVHFMESYYKKGYEDELLKSVKRKPTQHTVWMLNRI